ncbi:MAG: energy-coupling factor transporter ATP-binding protein EcfA2 [Candidatus Azotimanducaceae bacterium]|jgi:energy-coupling factor transporter ATP-binding protein EcfA2
MKLTHLEIQQLPGIEPGFKLEKISPGINLVTGPNAIGKSSLIRALQYLVSKDKKDDPAALSLSAEFTSVNGIDEMTARRTGEQIDWQMHNDTANKPDIIARDTLHHYWLTMENLVQVESAESSDIVARLQSEMAGGVDLTALRTQALKVGPRLGAAESTDLQNLRAKRRAIESEYSSLSGRATQELSALKRKIDAISMQLSRERRQEAALDLLIALNDQRDILASLGTLPTNMHCLNGHELSTLKQYESRQATQQQQHNKAAQDQQAATLALQDTGLATGSPDERTLGEQRLILSRTNRQRAELESHTIERDKQQNAAKTAWQTLGGGATPANLTTAQIDQAQTFIDRLRKTELVRDEIAARIEDAGTAPDPQKVEISAQATRLLSRWLATDEAASPIGKIILGVISITGLGTAILGVISNLWLVVGAGIVTTIAAIIAHFTAGKNPSRQTQLDYQQLGIDEPTDWQKAAVEQHLNTLQTELQGLLLARSRAEANAADTLRLTAKQAEIDTLLGEKATLAADLGFDPKLATMALGMMVRMISDFQLASTEYRVLSDKVMQIQSDISVSLQSVQQYLSTFGLLVEPQQETLEAALADLSDRSRQAATANSDIKVSQRNNDHATVELAQVTCDINDLYTAAGIDIGNRIALEAGVIQQPNWQALQTKLRAAQLQISTKQDLLVNDADLVQLAEDNEQQTLQQLLDDTTTNKDELDRLRNEHSDLQAKLNNTGIDRRLENANAEEAVAEAKLAEVLEKRQALEAGLFLLEDVEAEHQVENEPAILKAANGLFEAFTHNAWKIELTATGLQARDLAKNRLRALKELSSGTRMQLVLAIRLAWINQLEKHAEALPLFLDETLTSSDEYRFAAIVDSLTELSKQGRQIFYLSARQHELTLWNNISDESPHHIDLAKIRLGHDTLHANDYAVDELPKIPAPGHQSAEDYAALLCIPALNPQLDAGETPIFYLLRDDLPLLHQLYQDWHIRTLGPLLTWLQSSRIDGIAGPARDKLRARIDAAIHWHKAWQQGRGKPVDVVAVHKTITNPEQRAAVTARSAEPSVAYDAVALLASLANANTKIAGIGPSKQSNLQDYLLAEGYLSDELCLTVFDRERRVLNLAKAGSDKADLRQTVLWLEGGITLETDNHNAVEINT